MTAVTPGHARSLASRLWSPPGVPTLDAHIAFWRVQLGSTALGLAVFPLMLIGLVTWIVFHSNLGFRAAILVLAGSVGGKTAAEILRIIVILQQGYWLGRNREPIRRREHASRFWFRTSLHASGAMICGWAAAVMLNGLSGM